jgi:hypothetical protein
MEGKKLQKIKFHSSFEDQRLYSQQHSIKMNIGERLKEMNRLNKKLYGDTYGKLSKKTSLFRALPNETINEFYNRISNYG